MEPKSQAQSIVDYLASRIGQLEVEKAVLVEQLESKDFEYQKLKTYISKDNGT